MSAPFLTPQELEREARRLRAIDTPVDDDRPSRTEIEQDALEDRYPGTMWDEAA